MIGVKNNNVGIHCQQLTYWRSDRKGDTVAAVLDQVDNVAVVEAVDVHVVDCQDPVSNLQSAAALGRRT